jgi:NAD(P)H-hydrate epimerase
MPGAANLSALSALKTGCGKVFLCTNNLNNLPNEVIQVFPELNSVKKVIEKINVVIAGPGLGNKGSEILSFLWKENIPLILDADGINWLASNFLKKRKSLLIGTPHYGEARNLLGREFKNRFKALENIKNKYGGNWVLKGPGTLIKNNNNIYINNFSNSILATAGTGDILAGIIGGLVAQKVKEAEINGVLIHTAAAKALLNEGKKTIIASDLLAEINSSFTFL